MNSSTSSFKNELKVLAVVVALVGALDAYQRYYFGQPQGEAKLFHEFPAMADRLAEEKGTGMILLGNSLTQNGYDMALLKSRLEAQGNGDVHVEKVALSGSNPIEWYHNFVRFFVRRGETPSAIVIGMSPSGINDDLPAGYRIGWLAHETDWRDVPEVLFVDLKNAEVGGQYLQSRVSMLYASRWDIRVGLLSAMIPDLAEGMKWVNSGQIAPRAQAGKAPPKTYSLLTRLLEAARANHANVILVAMPARETYEIDPGLFDVLAAHQAVFLDCRTVPGLTAAGFEDGWHLNPDGAEIFTPYMAERLAAAARSFTQDPATRKAPPG